MNHVVFLVFCLFLREAPHLYLRGCIFLERLMFKKCFRVLSVNRSLETDWLQRLAVQNKRYNGGMKKNTLPQPKYIDTVNALELLAKDLAREPIIAIDTESNSLHAYKEQVCLIQFSTPTQDYLLDPLALPNLRILAPVFENPEIEKIFHAAEYDLICLKRDFDFHFSNLFDTLTAARILGYAKVGLGNLLQQKFGVNVNKKFQKANWGKRPLNQDMLNYARIDTHYLIEMRAMLKSELEEKKYWALAQEDFALGAAMTGLNKRKPPPVWERVSGRSKLDPRQATVLNEICLAREHLAQKLDRPPFKIVGNKALLKLVETQPKNQYELRQEALTPRQAERFGKAFLSAIKRGQKADLVKRTPRLRRNDIYRNRYDALHRWRKDKAISQKVESDIILPRFLMEEIAKENPRNLDELANIMSKSPWRLKEYGKKILALINEQI